MSESAAITSRNKMLSRGVQIGSRNGWLVLFIVLATGAFLAPATTFIVDGGIYYDMAKAFAEKGALHIGDNGGIEGAPALTKHLTVARNGLVYPQYPSGYAFLAAPFYLAFGINGLMLMNALAAGMCIWLTHQIARRMFDARIALWSAGLFAVATFAPTYSFVIWPHMLSLAFWLGSFYLAQIAHQTTSRKPAYYWLLGAGALIGAGLNIRVDVFLAALAIFFWLRLFSRPHDRIAPLMVALGMSPWLLFSAYINALKFGSFTPFTYGSQSGADNLGTYNVVLAAAGALLVIVWSLNINALAQRALKSFSVISIVAVCGTMAAAILVIPPARDLVWRIVEGVYVLVFNLQAHNAYYQAGVEPNEFGHLLFWGYPKKALIQSLPYLPLIILPAFYVFRGKKLSEITLCALAIAAPVAFYALNQWHGGGSYNMRYFLPATPFIAMLCAAALSDLMDKAGKPSRQTILIAFMASGIVYLTFQEIGQSSARWLTPGALYPQWLIAAALTVALVLYMRKQALKFAAPTLTIAVVAIAYAVTINLYEEMANEKTRYEQLVMARDASAPIPAGSLVVSQLPLLMAPAELRGVSVMVAREENAREAAQAVNAFAAAGRCVYFHNYRQRELVAPLLTATIGDGLIYARSRLFDHDPRLAFYLLDSTQRQCVF